MQKRLFTVLFVAFLGLFLSSCYLPKDFRLDVRLTKNGDYALRYEGELIAIGLRKKILEENLEGEKLLQELEIYKRDLTRDPAFSLVEYKEKGVFMVKYVYVSNVRRQANYSFLRGDNRIFNIVHDRKKDLITLRGRDFSEESRLSNMMDSYELSGEINVISDLELVHHNAGQVKATQTPSYLWQLNKDSLQVPFIIFALPEQ